MIRHGLLLATAGLLAVAGQLPVDADDFNTPGVPQGDRTLVTAAGDIHIDEPGYVLAASPSTGVVSVGTPGGHFVTSMPLTALVGRSALPAGAAITLSRSGSTIVADTVARDGSVLVHAVLVPGPQSLAITVMAVPGTDHQASPVFLSDGTTGLDLGSTVASWTPDPLLPADGSEMIVSSAGRRPLTPPPFDLQWQVPTSGWFGLGLAGVPSATSMWLSQKGVAVDYPLDIVARVPDTGSGGLVGSMVRFPALVMTVGAGSARDGLIAYRDALVARGDVPATPAAVATWAWQPIVDTWGEQMAEHIERGSPAFTAAWVRAFVADWTRRYGTSHITVVIDSRWQQTFGEAIPDARRFGGVAGMRALIDQLHAQGVRVELWWPMWAHGLPAHTTSTTMPGGVAAPLDPSTPASATLIRGAVETMLGSGPGQLNADGLKLDWSYAMSPTVADPTSGWGVALLHHYLALIHDTAHSTRADAVVETSAAAPQFADVSDVVRLYDAWSTADWSSRAMTVTATMPGVPIDGDGWQVAQPAAASHAVSSTVFGVPAVYFGRLWGDRTPVSAADSLVIGAVVALAPDKGAGTAAPVAGGSWRFTGTSGTVAESFNSERGLVVWSAVSLDGSRTGKVVATTSGQATVPLPLPAPGTVTAVDVGGRPVTVRPVRDGIRITLVAGETVHLRLSAGR